MLTTLFKHKSCIIGTGNYNYFVEVIETRLRKSTLTPRLYFHIHGTNRPQSHSDFYQKLGMQLIINTDIVDNTAMDQKALSPCAFDGYTL